MRPIAILQMRKASAGGGGGGTLDTQTVTTGNSGISPDRVRGFLSGSTGSIADGTSNIYSGAAITGLYFDEANSQYVLTITGAANSGWTALTIDGTTILNRASATFASGTWTWLTGDTITSQAFGAAGTNHTCVFT